VQTDLIHVNGEDEYCWERELSVICSLRRKGTSFKEKTFSIVLEHINDNDELVSSFSGFIDLSQYSDESIQSVSVELNCQNETESIHLQIDLQGHLTGNRSGDNSAEPSSFFSSAVPSNPIKSQMAAIPDAEDGGKRAEVRKNDPVSSSDLDVIPNSILFLLSDDEIEEFSVGRIQAPPEIITTPICQRLNHQCENVINSCSIS